MAGKIMALSDSVSRDPGKQIELVAPRDSPTGEKKWN